MNTIISIQIGAKVFPEEEEKENIEELFDLKLKPKKIYEILQENNFKITFNQLKNYLVLLRKKKFDASTLSLGQLKSLWVEKTTVPQTDDKPFILSYNGNYEDGIDDD